MPARTRSVRIACSRIMPGVCPVSRVRSRGFTTLVSSCFVVIARPPPPCSRRDAEPEPRPPVRRLDTDASATELDELFHDRETDARAATRSVARFLYSIKALEHVRQVGRRDALTGVAHRHDDIAAVASTTPTGSRPTLIHPLPTERTRSTKRISW